MRPMRRMDAFMLKHIFPNTHIPSQQELAVVSNMALDNSKRPAETTVEEASAQAELEREAAAAEQERARQQQDTQSRRAARKSSKV